MSTGYMKIPGDACVIGNGLNYEPYQAKCFSPKNNKYITTSPQVMSDTSYVLLGGNTMFKINGESLSASSKYTWDF
ncbi:hypothetical protein, partial [Salmonella sp. s54836]|uniref:hypothetical protein n=1 Tax=Salmonella sp. s54836 TaxID=3159673 RepID=UPI00397F8466